MVSEEQITTLVNIKGIFLAVICIIHSDGGEGGGFNYENTILALFNNCHNQQDLMVSFSIDTIKLLKNYRFPFCYVSKG